MLNAVIPRFIKEKLPHLFLVLILYIFLDCLVTWSWILTLLLEFFFDTFGIRFNERWFVNLTDTDFPTETKWLVSLGAKFALPSNVNNFPLFTFIADTEHCINYIEDHEEREIARAMVTNIMMNHNKNQIQQPLLQRTIRLIHDDTLNFLKKNRDIVILRADKGGAVFAMNKADYYSKRNDIFNDDTKYAVLKTKNPRTGLQTKANKLASHLRDEGVITESQRQRMTKYNTHVSRVYGMPKIHKQPVTLRHVVSTVDSPSSQLAI